MQQVETIDGPRIDLTGAVLLDSSARTRAYALPLSSRHVVSLSESAFAVLEACETSPTYEAAAQALARSTRASVSPAELRRAHRRIRDKIRRIDAAPRQGWPFWDGVSFRALTMSPASLGGSPRSSTRSWPWCC